MNTSDNRDRVCSQNQSEATCSKNTYDPGPLTHVVHTTSFCQIAPKVKAALEYMDTSETTILEVLENNIERLQNAFVEAIYAFFHCNEIDLTEKVTLRLADSMLLSLSGNHPEKDRLNRLLAASPELARAFAELASQSSALKDLHNLHSMVMNSLFSELPAPQINPCLSPSYVLSIKGDMNHFYFSVFPQNID